MDSVERSVVLTAADSQHGTLLETSTQDHWDPAYTDEEEQYPSSAGRGKAIKRFIYYLDLWHNSVKYNAVMVELGVVLVPSASVRNNTFTIFAQRAASITFISHSKSYLLHLIFISCHFSSHLWDFRTGTANSITELSRLWPLVDPLWWEKKKNPFFFPLQNFYCKTWRQKRELVIQMHETVLRRIIHQMNGNILLPVLVPGANWGPERALVLVKPNGLTRQRLTGCILQLFLLWHLNNFQ